MEKYRQRCERRDENRSLHSDIKTFADHESEPHCKVVEQIYAVGISGNSSRESREKTFRQFPEKARSQTDTKTNEPSSLDGLIAGEQHEGSAR
jgi:hypothetical protein